jgi:hypothetical protein
VLRNLDSAGRGRAIEPAGSEGMPFLPFQGYYLIITLGISATVSLQPSDQPLSLDRNDSRGG